MNLFLFFRVIKTLSSSWYFLRCYSIGGFQMSLLHATMEEIELLSVPDTEAAKKIILSKT